MSFRGFITENEKLKSALKLTKHYVSGTKPAPKKSLGQRIAAKVVSMFGGKPKGKTHLRSPFLNTHVIDSVRDDKRKKIARNIKFSDLATKGGEQRKSEESLQSKMFRSAEAENKRRTLVDKSIAKRKAAKAAIPRNTRKISKNSIKAQLGGIRDAVKRLSDDKIKAAHEKIKGKKKQGPVSYSIATEFKARKAKKTKELNKFNK